MVDLIQKLVDLCELDKEVHDLRESLALYPKMLADLDAREKAADRKQQEAREGFEKTRETLRKSELEVATLREEINKYLGQQAQVKTNREYNAVNQEIDAVKAKIDAAEEEGLGALEEQERFEKRVKESGDDLVRLREELKTERARIDGQVSDKEAQLEKNEAEHRRRVEDLPEDHQEIYELLNERFPGTAVVPVKEGGCGGCSMNLVTQRVLDVRRGEVSVRCDNCARILYDPSALQTAGSSGESSE